MTARIVLLAVLLTGSAIPASAHSPIKGIGTFYNELLHPIIVPSHLLALIAIGLLIGQRAPSDSRLALPAFAAAVALALLATALTPHVPPAWPLLAVTLVTGLAIVISWRAIPTLILAVAAGTLIALNSSPDGIPAEQIWIALTGTGSGAVLAVTYCGGLAARFDRPWQKIAVRAAGSWISASALLVLSLHIFAPASIPS